MTLPVAQVPTWYRRLLRLQLLFGAVYGVLLLVAPLPLIHFSLQPLPPGGSGGGGGEAPSLLQHQATLALEDFALWLGAAHLCFAALAWVGLSSSVSSVAEAGDESVPVATTIPRSTLVAVALPSLVYFAISAFFVDIQSLFFASARSSVANAGGTVVDVWQGAAMAPAMVAEMLFSAGHAVMLMRRR